MTIHKNNPAPTEEWFYLSLREVTYTFGVSTETIIEIVNEGIVSAQKDDQDELQFDNEAFRRIHKVLSLTKDLGVNLAGAGLAIELLEEIDRLQKLLQTK
ncbi:MAG: chaperone modulator CbpM [Legionella sp.]|nr:chaperone modulator CbpM [Legionella sp.]